MYRESTTGLWCREDTLDEYVIKEQRCYDPLFQLKLMKGNVVLDIGANIGAFAYRALKAGASQVICFEPDPDNIEVFNKQKLENVKLVKGAISQNKGTAQLYRNGGKNKGMHSLQKINGRETVTVKTYPFIGAIERYSPDLIKIDIEGGEFEFDLSHIPEGVKGIAIEIHLNHKGNRELAVDLINQLKKQFPNVLKDPHITDKNWTTLFIGTRRGVK